DLRVTARSDTGKPAVALQIAFQRAFLDAVDLKVVMAYFLRAACLARKVHALNVRGHAGAARIDHVRHGTPNWDPVIRVDGHTHHVGLAALRLDQIFVLWRQLLRIDHVWPVKSAAHGDAANGACNLYRAYGHRTLSNAYRDHLAGIPLLVKVSPLPF